MKEGPFSFEELVSRKLESFDLIWKVGHSSHWLYPFEVEELKSFVDHDHFHKKESLLNDLITLYNPDLKTRFQQLVEVLKKKLHEHFRERKIRFHKSAINIFGFIIAVIIGLIIIGAVSIKNIVNDKISLKHGPVSLLAKNVAPPVLPEGSVPHQPINRHFQNALVTELEEKNYERQSKMLHDHWKKQVLIKGNDYSFGKNGGVQDLYLTVKNKTTLHLRNVKVQVDYLDAESKLIISQIITIKHIPARSERSWKMRDTDKGVKVQYKVLNIFSKKKKSIFFEA